MEIHTITTEEMCRGAVGEGLILEGCGGDLQEWVDGINDMLTESGILKNDTRFEKVSKFEHDGLICLLFHFENVDLNMGSLAVWRLQTRETFGSMWLSDFVDNYLGGPLEVVHEGKNQEQKKPDCPLIGQNGNIYNLLGIAARTLREHDRKDQAEEMTDRVFASGSYEEALCIIGEYVNITDSHEEREERLSICQQLRREDLPKHGSSPKQHKQQER